uniref:Ribosome biogenesis protein NOP53 n=1 Tax=Phlebotomus papatasi TaxID=29031 RepID=A0A1B0D0C4_PHLPP
MKNAKKKKISRKNKSSWRKHVDISDVDNFLESSRLDERIGTVADVPNAGLFQEDKTPSRKNMVTMKHSSKVPGNPSKTEESKQIAFDHDLWNVEKPAVQVEKKKTELESEWLSAKLLDHHLRNSGTATFRVPKTARKETSKIKAFEPPHPGMSYNPRKVDYRSLIEDVVKNEEVLMKKDEHLSRVTTEMFTKMTAEEKEKQVLQEMSVGLGLEMEIKQEDEIKKEFPDEEDAGGAINPPVERKPKSRKALRKKVEEMKRREALKKSKVEKKKISDIIQIGKLKQAIVKKEMKLANRRNRDDKAEVDKDFRPRRIGPLVFKEADIDVAYPDEVTGNLRTTMNHGSILKDRFVSLEKRNMVVPSKKQMVRKRHKVKTYVKNTHKGFVVKPINNYQPRRNK